MNLHSRSSGVLLHPSSLPGPHGIGDLGPDAYRFVDWLAQAGQTLWQMLPVNPIGPGYSPYQSVSAFAGSPLMVALEPLVQSGWLIDPAGQVPDFDTRSVDFEHVVAWRQAQLRTAAAGFFDRATAADSKAFAAWCAAEAEWLDDFALFMALEVAHDGQPWWNWPDALRWRRPPALVQARCAHAVEVQFWRFVQWCFDTQFTRLKTYANQRGVALVGDLPIFIAHHSADCWTRPDLYELDETGAATVLAGAPPDELGPEGQIWGNPLYRWDRMADEGYAWWTARMRRSLVQADVLRIDHFRGFAACWAIPTTATTARDGHFRPGPGKALFDAMEAALGKLPIIAEDLGLITPDVVALRVACGYPGMKIMQYAFAGDATHEYLPHNYAPGFAVYSGTHDNDTARGWWMHASPHERAFASAYLGCEEQTLHWAMIRAASLSVASMAVFQMQDLMGRVERMNLPGTLGGLNWAWRFEWADLADDTAQQLAVISAASGRGPFAALGAPAQPVGTPD
jgi:4-alpha-glucanotransferase